jgi:hypothetical protein
MADTDRRDRGSRVFDVGGVGAGPAGLAAGSRL